MGICSICVVIKRVHYQPDQN
ncbi:erythromycin resistance leader peptide [Halalkalibacter sp. APA_J-10(15)]